MMAVVAILFSGCKQQLAKEEVEKTCTEFFKTIKEQGIDKAAQQFAEGYDKLSDQDKQLLKDAKIFDPNNDFKIVKIEGDKVTAEVSVKPANGGEVTVNTVIFQVIKVDGKVRVKDIIELAKSKFEVGGEPSAANTDTESDDASENTADAADTGEEEISCEA